MGWLKLDVDGSYDRSSSRIACGGLVRDHTDAWLIGFTGLEGDGDPYLVELLAVVWGLHST